MTSPSNEFDPLYQQAFNALMVRDVAQARGLGARLSGLAETRDQTAQALNLDGMLARATALEGSNSLGERSLRGWHMVMTGGVILRVSNRRTGDGAHNRRFGLHKDGPPVALEAVRKIAYVTGVFDLQVPNILFYPDWASAVLAHALGKAFGKMPRALTLPCEMPGIIIVYDMERLPLDQQLAFAQRKPGQMLWNHISRFTVDHPVAADFTTVLCRTNETPWEPGEDGRVPGGDSPFDLAEDVSTATLYDDALADVPRIITMCRAVASKAGEHGPSFLRSEGRRSPQPSRSPVSRGPSE